MKAGHVLGSMLYLQNWEQPLSHRRTTEIFHDLTNEWSKRIGLSSPVINQSINDRVSLQQISHYLRESEYLYLLPLKKTY